MAVEELSDLLAAGPQTVRQQRGQSGADSEFVGDPVVLAPQRADVAVGQGDVGALQRPAVAQVRADGVVGVAVGLAQRLGRVEPLRLLNACQLLPREGWLTARA